LPDLTDAHSIPYQNEIQYFSLKHEEKVTLALFKLQKCKPSHLLSPRGEGEVRGIYAGEGE